MRLLLDTHILLWALNDDPALTPPQRQVLGAAEIIFVSAVSLWEISIKQALGKLDAPADLMEVIARTGCQPLAISWAHAMAAGRLPRLHGDPFDHLLIAQAQGEGLTLMSADRMIRRYDVAVV